MPDPPRPPQAPDAARSRPLNPDDPVQVWAGGLHNPHGGHGGWAWVAVQGADIVGLAGGGRGATSQGMALTAAVAALKAAGPGQGAVAVHLPGPIDTKADPDLWAALAVARKARPVRLLQDPPAPAKDTPAAFVAAWAAFAVDKVKASGPFTAAIPRLNLQKFPRPPRV